jgi:hypothetical protein
MKNPINEMAMRLIKENATIGIEGTFNGRYYIDLDCKRSGLKNVADCLKNILIQNGYNINTDNFEDMEIITDELKNIELQWT